MNKALVHRALAAVVGVILSAACGGGGGGVDHDGSWLTFDPSGTLSAHVLRGHAAQLTVSAHSARSFDRPIDMLLVDESGTFKTMTLSPDSPWDYTAELTSQDLEPGHHTGAITLRLCFDDARTCALPLPGSPWTIPFDIEVQGFALTPLAAVPGAQPWSTYGGTAAHVPALPGTYDPAAFTLRWWKAYEPDFYVNGGFVADADHFYVQTAPVVGALPQRLRAYDEANGDVLFTVDLPDVLQVSPLAAAGGRVFVVASDNTLWAYDGTTGAELYHQPFTRDPAGTLLTQDAPTPYGDSVYVGFWSGQASGVARFDAATGEYLGDAPVRTDEPVIRNGLMYSLGVTVDDLVAVSVSDGSVAWSHRFPYDGYAHYGTALPVSDGIVCVRDGSSCARTDTFEITHTGYHFRTLLGLAGDRVLVLDGPNEWVTAYDYASNDLRWQSQQRVHSNLMDGRMDRLPVPSDNLLFVLDNYSVTALDLTTGLPAWTLPASDWAISANGTMFLLNRGEFVTVNLR